MAQINIIGNINDQQTILRFNATDTNLIGTQQVNNDFHPQTDYIEYAIYNAVGNFLNINYSYNGYTLPNNQSFNVNGSYPILEINPTADLQIYASVGEFKPQYSFFRKHISDNTSRDLFIKDISPDRTELRISSLTFTSEQISKYTNDLITDKDSVPYLKTYLLNFGNNVLIPITNVILDTTDPLQSYILFKLYEPLSTDITEKSSLWVVEEISPSTQYDVSLESQLISSPLPQLKGANFNIEVHHKNTLPTQYVSQNTLMSLTGSSVPNILNYLNQSSIQINVNYSGSFDEFSRFGSVQARLNGFYSKVKQIEDYNSFISNYSGSVATTASLQAQINQYSSSILNYTTNFDGFESYLYFQSGSGAWPKSNTTSPYALQSTGSTELLTWFSNITNAAIYYDNNNPDNLIYLIPEYIRVDEANTPYLTFINMIGHYFDNIWIYLKSVTDLYKSYNNINQGVSRDLVYYALQDLGVKIYNSNEDDDLFNYIIGDNQIPSKDLLAELYKRIYHNIPLLFKGKGSVRGLQELITTFGITGSILGIKEYGGEDITQAALLDYSNNKVRIINNTIYSSSYSSSILSHQIPLASNNVYNEFKNDSNRIDISFSPYNQIDTAISASIISTYPTFSINDYLGDPRYSGSVTYGGLDLIRSAAISSSFAYKYDIDGFIQLIQYFDNTLFKTLKDYVPAKTNLIEGITIRQQALERIKFPRIEPDVDQEDIEEVCFSSASIQTEYTDLYSGLSGDKEPYYGGDISGSQIDTYGTYFIPSNSNPYLIYPSGTRDERYFGVSDYSVLFNNISASRLSIDKYKVEIQPYSTHSLLVPVSFPDSYDTLRSYQLSRHEGVKLTGAKYNEYTLGDISYGLNSVIDRNSYKFGWVKAIPSINLNFYNKTSIILKYLVDPSGSLLELNSHNQNLFEIQNIFKSSTSASVSISDLLSPSNQTSLNGQKTIFQGGYKYDPIIYREQNETLYFQWSDLSMHPSIYNIGVGTLLGNSYEYDAIGTGQKTYFDNIPNPDSISTVVTKPKWYKDNTIQSTLFSNYRILKSAWIYGAPNHFGVLQSYTGSDNVIYTVASASGGSLGQSAGELNAAWGFDNLAFNEINTYTESTPGLYSYQGSSYTYKAPRAGTYTVSSSLPVYVYLKHNNDATLGTSGGVFKIFTAIERTATPLVESSWVAQTFSHITPTSYPTYEGNGAGSFFGYNKYEGSIFFGDAPTYNQNWSFLTPFTFNLDITQNIGGVGENDYIRARVYILCINAVFGSGTDHDPYFDPFIFKFGKNASFTIFDATVTGTNNISTGSFGQSPELLKYIDTTNLYITGSAQQFYESSSFISYGSSISDRYTPVVDIFTVQPGDLMRLGSFYSPSAQYATVTGVSNYSMSFDQNISASFAANKSNRFAILRRKPDETSVIINHIKQPGGTSQTFLIPGDMSKDNANNVANVATQVSTQINNLPT